MARIKSFKTNGLNSRLDRNPHALNISCSDFTYENNFTYTVDR